MTDTKSAAERAVEAIRTWILHDDQHDPRWCSVCETGESVIAALTEPRNKSLLADLAIEAKAFEPIDLIIEQDANEVKVTIALENGHYEPFGDRAVYVRSDNGERE